MTNQPDRPNDESKPAKIEYFSFWKPDPLPPRDSKIHPVELQSLGTLESVTEKLTDVPHLSPVPQTVWDVQDENPAVRFRWYVEEGVILQIRVEKGPPKPGEVLTIGAASAAPKTVFYRLYIQIYEQFGVTLFDEGAHDFFTPKEFKLHLAS